MPATDVAGFGTLPLTIASRSLVGRRGLAGLALPDCLFNPDEGGALAPAASSTLQNLGHMPPCVHDTSRRAGGR
jgi:hypothetical protein